MNERIKELAEQATKQVTKPDGHYIVQEWQKVFAVLIVQECIDQVQSGIDTTEPDQYYDFYRGLVTAKELIEYHFGVEE